VNFFLAVIGVLGISASGPLLAGINAPALTMAFWRNAAGAAVIGSVAAINQRRELAAIDRRTWFWVAVAAVALAAHFATWVTSLKLTSVAASTALVCMQMGWIALFNRLRGERIPGKVLLGLVLAFAGVLLISGFDVNLAPQALLGDLLALLGGIFAAIYTVTGAKVRRCLSTTSYAALCYGGCAVLLLVLCLATGTELVRLEPAAWLGIAAVTVLAQLMGHTVFNHLLAVMSPMLVSLLILLEIPGAAILAAVFLGQVPPAGTYAGLVLILAGLAVVVLAQSRTRQRGQLRAGIAAD
jgi:drug/metabolite transporter (DMT)-like permease